MIDQQMMISGIYTAGGTWLLIKTVKKIDEENGLPQGISILFMTICFLVGCILGHFPMKYPMVLEAGMISMLAMAYTDHYVKRIYNITNFLFWFSGGGFVFIIYGFSGTFLKFYLICSIFLFLLKKKHVLGGGDYYLLEGMLFYLYMLAVEEFCMNPYVIAYFFMMISLFLSLCLNVKSIMKNGIHEKIPFAPAGAIAYGAFWMLAKWIEYGGCYGQ